MSVRAKFRCHSVNKFDRSNDRYSGNKAGEPKVAGTVEMFPVIASENHPENKIFGEASPAGKIEIMIVDEKVVDQFKPGKDYYVDFTEAV